MALDVQFIGPKCQKDEYQTGRISVRFLALLFSGTHHSLWKVQRDDATEGNVRVDFPPRRTDFLGAESGQDSGTK